MKRLYSTLITFLALAVACHATDKYPELHIFNNPHLAISMEIVDKVKFKYSIDDKSTQVEPDTTFVIIDNEFETFKEAFKNILSNKLASKIGSRKETEKNDEVSRVYYFFKATEILGPNLNFKPEAGVIHLNNNLSIEEITATDYMIRGMAKQAQRKMKPETRRGIFFEKIYNYQNKKYTKLELRTKIFNETSAYFAAEPRRVFYSESLPSYYQFLRSWEVRIEEYRKENEDIKRITASVDALNRELTLKKDETSRNLEDFKKYSRNYWSAADASGFSEKLPDIPSSNFDVAKNTYRRLLRENISQLKQEIDEMASTLGALSADSLLTVRDKISEVKRKKHVLDSLVSAPYNNFLSLAEKWTTSNSTALKISEELSVLTTTLTHKKESSEEKRSGIDSFYRMQNDSLNKLQKQFSKITKLSFRADNIDLEINEGFIENVLVIGKIVSEKIKYYNSKFIKTDTIFGLPETSIKFENRYPIGFSRKRDFENMKQKNLFTMDGNLPKYRLHLEDLLQMYYQRHEVNRRDFCPADTVLRVTFDTQANSKYNHTVYKDATFKILEAKIFSDFVGLDKTNPNGLIQLEVEKKISLITNRYPRKVFKYEMWNFGFLSYIIPSLNLSKIEENNRELPLLYRDEVVNGQYHPQKYASTLELKRFENFSTGFDLNIALLDIPTFKSTFYLDYGFKYGRVAIVDSLRDYSFQTNLSTRNGRVINYGVNTLQFYPRISWLVRSDERYSFDFSGSVNWYFLRANDFKQIANNEVFSDFNEQGMDRRVFANVSMLATLKPNTLSKGKLFFRYQYNWQLNYSNTGFHQAQVGYSFYLLSRRN